MGGGGIAVIIRWENLENGSSWLMATCSVPVSMTGAHHRPIGYYSQQLDPVAKELPPRVRVTSAAAMALL